MKNLLKIQKIMREKDYDFFIINRTDEFLGEYIAPYAERLKWVSNFTGSAGRIIILKNKATIFIDGRYTLQVKQQVNNKLFNFVDLSSYWTWLNKKIYLHSKIAIDINLHSIEEIKKLKVIIKKKKSKIIYLKKNPIDFLWKNQPEYPQSQVFFHDLKYAGKTHKDKLNNIYHKLKSLSVDYYLLTSLDSIAWLLNIRGNDILYTPLALSFAIINKDGKIDLFIDLKKITKIKSKLKDNVNFHSFSKIKKFISKINKKFVLGLDKTKVAYVFEKICKENSIKIKYLSDPCVYPKSQKNYFEIKGARNANLKDGFSITKFLYWLENEMVIENTDEIKAAKYLYNLRKKNDLFFSSSFETISAIGENSALPHYKLTNNTNKPFKKNTIYLVDSGAQYLDGTTDITRTVILGKPTKEQKDRFTRVLKGHIAIANAKFKINSKGSKLDFLARSSLLKIGCDYNHGTGHGIGSFLSVHEGPQRIAKAKANVKEGKIKEGMILSNEPGYYKEFKYGIRTENLILTIKDKSKKLKFETISFAPIDKRLIDKSILTSKEINWINLYHKKVFLHFAAKMTNKEKKWLKKVTKPIKN